MKIFKNLRIQLVLLSTLLTGFSINAVVAEEFYAQDLPPVVIINTEDFRIDSNLAASKKMPILILFAMEGCGYCEFVEEEHLKPMLRNPEDYANKVIIRRVMTDDFDDIIDFDGNTISSLDFSSRYNASLTPTVVLLDHTGKELSRILGVSNTEFYGGDLDNSINLSLQMIREQLASLE